MSISRDFHCVSAEIRSFFTLQGPTTITALGGDISIGKRVGINGSTIYCTDTILIGDGTMIAPGCIICDTDGHHIDNPEERWNLKGPSAPIVIGRNVWIGTRSIVLKGVTVGDGTVIGAGSVVTKDLPSGVLAAGVPAKVIRKLNSNSDDCW